MRMMRKQTEIIYIIFSSHDSHALIMRGGEAKGIKKMARKSCTLKLARLMRNPHVHMKCIESIFENSLRHIRLSMFTENLNRRCEYVQCVTEEIITSY